MQTACFEAGVQFARAEGILPAPEANHAVRGAIDEAIRCREEGVSRVDPVQPLRARPLRHAGLHGLLRRQAHRPDYDESELAMALAGLPSVAGVGASVAGSRLRAYRPVEVKP